MGNESLVERLYKLGAGGVAEATEAADEIEKLLVQREAEARRLDWLMIKLNGRVTRRMVGEMNDTSDPAEWRKKLDAAMGPGWPDA